MPSARAAEATSPQPERLWYVDHIRVALTMLVVLHHLAVSYSAVAPWYYIELPQSDVAQLLAIIFVLVNQSYFMGAFFLLAGYFTPGSYDRKGGAGFVRDRLVRLGIPLLIFTTLIGPSAALIGYGSVAPLLGITQPIAPWQWFVGSIGVGPLWFVEALLIAGLAYALWRSLRRSAPAAPGALPGAAAIIGFVLALACATFLLRLWLPVGASLPIVGFPTPGHLPQYLALFIVGAVAYRRDWLSRIPASYGRAGFIAAFAATLLIFLPTLILSDTGGAAAPFTGGMTWQAAAYALWEAIMGVAMPLGLLTLFRRRFSQHGPLARFLSSQAYTVYIIHALVIVALCYALGPLALPALAKFALAAALGLPLCFGLAYLIRLLPGVKRILA